MLKDIRNAASNTKLVVALLCFICFLINYKATTPGFMSPDSYEQYEQSLSHIYRDWHPPIMAWVWSQLNYIYQGPQVMLVLQLAFLWLACFFLTLTFNNNIWRVFVLSLFLLSPVIQNFSGYIIKDVQMAYSWLLAFSLLAYYHIQNKKASPGIAIATILLLVYGTWLRQNAFPATIPLVALWTIIFFPNLSSFKRVIVSGVILLLFWIGFVAFNKIVKSEKQYAENKIYLHDLTGIYATTGADVFPQILYQNEQFDTGYLRKKYHPATFDDIWWNKDNVTVLPDTTAEITRQVRDAWTDAIIKFPGVYIQQRIAGYLYYLRFQKRSDFYCNYYMYMYPEPTDYDFSPNYGSIFYRFYWNILDVHKNMFYMQPWFWLFVNIGLLGFIPFFKSNTLKPLFITLVMSGVLYKIPDLFVYQSDVDYRYFYWNSIVCVIAIALLFMSGKSLGKG